MSDEELRPPDAPRAKVGGGLSEELFYTLLADGVPRNQAIQIAGIADHLTRTQIEFLGSLTTDASGQTILNDLGPDVPIGEGSFMRDVIAFVVSGQGEQFIDRLLQENNDFEDAYADYQAKLAEFTEYIEFREDKIFEAAAERDLTSSQYLELIEEEKERRDKITRDVAEGWSETFEGEAFKEALAEKIEGGKADSDEVRQQVMAELFEKAVAAKIKVSLEAGLGMPDFDAFSEITDNAILLAKGVQEAQVIVAPDVPIVEGVVTPLQPGEFATTGLQDVLALQGQAPLQTAAARATGLPVAPDSDRLQLLQSRRYLSARDEAAFQAELLRPSRQRAELAVSEAEHSRFQAEFAFQQAESQRLAREETIYALNRRGTLPGIPRPTFTETVGTLPAGAGSPAFRGFVERAPATLRQQVEELPGGEQLPFLRRRFSELGPQARGDFPARFAPPARTLSRR